MNTTEHLNLIKAFCLRNLEIASKRTPGEWVYENRNGKTKNARPDGWGSSGLWVKDDPTTIFNSGRGWDAGFDEPSKADAAFITTCAGAAEAGWKATIAAVTDILEYYELHKGTEIERDILAAYPLTMIQK